MSPHLSSTSRLSVVVVAVVAVALAAPQAGADDGDWSLRLAAAWIEPDVALQDPVGGDDNARLGGDAALGMAVDLEYLLTERIGLELGVLEAEPDLVLEGDLDDDNRITVGIGQRMTVFSAGCKFHLSPNGVLDLHGGPFVNYVVYGDPDLKLSINGEDLIDGLDSSPDLSWGLAVGVDVRPASGPWFLSAGVRYLDSTLTISGSDGDEADISVDPLVVTMGLGVRL